MMTTTTIIVKTLILMTVTIIVMIIVITSITIMLMIIILTIIMAMIRSDSNVTNMMNTMIINTVTSIIITMRKWRERSLGQGVRPRSSSQEEDMNFCLSSVLAGTEARRTWLGPVTLKG